MTIPGPASEITGVATILALGALATLAGHSWGAIVVTTADLVLLGKLWPAILLGTDPTWAYIAAAAMTVPGVLLFAATLPTTAHAILGDTKTRTQRLGASALALMAVAYLAMPALA